MVLAFCSYCLSSHPSCFLNSEDDSPNGCCAYSTFTGVLLAVQVFLALVDDKTFGVLADALSEDVVALSVNVALVAAIRQMMAMWMNVFIDGDEWRFKFHGGGTLFLDMRLVDEVVKPCL